MNVEGPDRNFSVILLVLRRLRGPLILMVTLFALSVLGMALAPGPPDAEGRPTHLSLFHAFYFVSYTATTIGFGEVPEAFSDAQRLWAIVVIYLSVLAWAYLLKQAVTLMQDEALRRAVAALGFARRVRRLHHPFVLIAGFGETGAQLALALDREGIATVALDLDPKKIERAEMMEFVHPPVTLAADASDPNVLLAAGLRQPRCAAVAAMTDDDAANLAVTVTQGLLAPRLPTVCRAEHDATVANMAEFATTAIIDPFHVFQNDLALALEHPAAWRVRQILLDMPMDEIRTDRPPPRGRWIICGAGRLGLAAEAALRGSELELVVIDRAATDGGKHSEWITGDATQAEVLRRAGIEKAVGIVAATSNDIDNISILVAARRLNPSLYTIVRQNRRRNEALFAAFHYDLRVVPRHLVAAEALAWLRLPEIPAFLAWLANAPQELAQDLQETLLRLRRHGPLRNLKIAILPQTAPALWHALADDSGITLERLLRSPSLRPEPLALRVLALEREGHWQPLPEPSTLLRRGDVLLVSGTAAALADLKEICGYEPTLYYVLEGRERPQTWLGRWWAKRAPEG